MKAFIASCAAAVIIAVVAAVIFNLFGWDSAEVYSTANVRL